MSTSAEALSGAPSAKDLDMLVMLLSGPALISSLLAICEFGVADALGEEAQTPGELAAKAGVNGDVLGRSLRLLASCGVFKKLGPAYCHTPLSRMMRADHPMSMAGTIKGYRTGLTLMTKFDYSMQTGRPAVEQFSKDGIWQYFAERPEEARAFNAMMTSKSQQTIGEALAIYDFGAFQSLADVGGGRGHFIRAVLKAHPRVQGFLLDLPHVIGEVAGEQVDRLTMRGGDFFKDDLPQCDAYFLMNIIHDWNDEDSIAILRNVRRRAPAQAKLLLAEGLLPEEAVLDTTAMLNVYMIAYAEGHERTKDEYEALMTQAGWKLDRVVTGQSGMSIMEAIPA